MNSIIKHAICKVAESLIICLCFVVLLLLRLVKSDYINSWLLAALLSFFFQSKKVSSLASVTWFIQFYLT